MTCVCGKQSYPSRNAARRAMKCAPGGKNLTVYQCSCNSAVFHLHSRTIAKKKRRWANVKSQQRPRVKCVHGEDVFACPDCLRVRKSFGMVGR